MTEFSVKPGALRTYAHLLGEYGGAGLNLADLYDMKVPAYTSSNVEIDLQSGTGDLFQHIIGSNTSLVSNLRSSYLEAWSMFRVSAVNLDISATVYRDTDEQQAERMDRVWKGLPPPVPVDDAATGATVSDPTVVLDSTPSSDVMLPDPVHWVMDAAGWLSVGDDVLKVASVFGFDPASTLTKAVVGDYGQVARAGHACTALAECERANATAVTAGLTQMTAHWTGQGADAATAYFHQVANAFRAHADQLDDVAHKYELLAQACAQIAEILSGLLADALDKLLICVGALASAGCLQAVPVVDVIADIIGAYEVFVTARSIKTFTEACGRVTDIVETFLGLTFAIASACEPGTATTSFPVGAYRNESQ
ncbi:hypothetical protein BH11ACT8_BH11ACT8_11720 [soil metagenome]